jgi:TnpA family transposase
MADASGISEDQLAWTSQWYLRQETLRAANTRLVNAHHAHPLAALWGGGTLSSSDGQRLPQRGRNLTARALSQYFLDEGTTPYTHVSDQHSTYGTKVIPTTWREAVAVLDEIFGSPTELPLGEHTADTAGQTLATFAIFNLAGSSSPRASVTSAACSSTASGPSRRGAPGTRATPRPVLRSPRTRTPTPP